MSLTNADIRSALGQLAEAVSRADKALADSDDLPSLALAETMVESMKLSAKLAKLADKVQRLSAPLFGQANGAADGKPAGHKRK